MPGNHDVNRKTAGDVIITAVRERILAKVGEDRERAFMDSLRDPKAGPELIKPMAEYNQFAARYGCDAFMEFI